MFNSTILMAELFIETFEQIANRYCCCNSNGKSLISGNNFKYSTHDFITNTIRKYDIVLGVLSLQYTTS